MEMIIVTRKFKIPCFLSK